MNLVNLLVERAARAPDRVALADGKGRTLTFSELEQRTRVRPEGLQRGEVVLFAHPVSIDLYVALLAVLRMGAVAMFVDPGAGRAGIRSAIRRLPPEMCFGNWKARLVSLSVPEWRRIPSLTWGRNVDDVESCAEDDPALVTFTSGSTGPPKAVVRSHRFLVTQYEVLARSLEFEEGEMDLVTLPIFTLANLAAGMTSVLADTNLARLGKTRSARIDHQIRREKVTRLAASPAFLRRLLNGGADLTGLSRIYSGGAPVFPGLLEKLTRAAPDARVAAVYGSTEAEPIAHLPASEISEGDRQAMRAGKGLLAGEPVPEIELAVLSGKWGKPIEPMKADEFKTVQAGADEPGEIVVTGEHVLKGYLNGAGDEETKFRAGDQIWHRTGDCGYLDELGRLWLLGRSEAVIRDGKGELFPFAVECALSFHHEIAWSAVVTGGYQRVLVIQPAEGAKPCPDRILGEAPWARLDRCVQLRRMPLDRRHNAKIDYPALRKRLRF